jgi:hypothetical protein
LNTLGRAAEGKRGRQGVRGEDATRRGNGLGACPRLAGGAPTVSQPTRPNLGTSG